MSIFTYFQSVENEVKQDENANEKALAEAVKMFEKQQDSLYAIRRSSGLKEIRSYFEREKEACEKLFRAGVKPEFFQYMQGKYAITCGFLDFLDHLMNAP